MKKTLLTLIWICCCFAGFSNEPVEVVVLMKAHYDRAQLCQKAEYIPTRAARRDFVVSELKAFTEVSQAAVRAELAEWERQGLVSSVQSLWSANALHLTATEEVLQALAERPDIESIHPVELCLVIPQEDKPIEAPALRYVTPNVNQVNAPAVWRQGYRGEGVVIAVLDSGVNYNHMDLADHLWDGGEAFPHHGTDVFNLDDDPMDDLGHGTHCAGTVCGDGTAGLSTGVAPEATLMCVKCTNEEGYSEAVYFVKGMEWAVEHGCDAISMSLGKANAQVADKELMRHTCEALLDAGIVAVVAVGNERNLQHLCPLPNNVRTPGNCPPPILDREQMANPGGLSCVIAVGAVDENDTVASFSSMGPVTWQNTEFGDYAYDPGIGLIRPDVCAPGVLIWSLKYNTINDYDFMSGTSQATPCVAGIVALMLSKNPELTPAEIYLILERTAVKLSPTKNNSTGVGRVDALAAMNEVPLWDAVDDDLDLIGDGAVPSHATLQVIDMNGRMVMSRQDAIDHFSTESLSPGIYLLRIIQDHQVKTRKIVIE